AKNPDERYQTAKDMLIDLRSLKRQLELKAEIERTSSPSTERVAVIAEGQSKKRVLLIAVGAMLLVTAAILGVNLWRSSRQRATPIAQPTPVALEERTLTYWITVQKYRGNKPYQDPFPMAGEINFEADYRIRVNVRTPQRGYLYVINEGPAAAQSELVVLFPSPTANDGSPLLSAEQLVQIPELTRFKFDADRG